MIGRAENFLAVIERDFNEFSIVYSFYGGGGSNHNFPIRLASENQKGLSSICQFLESVFISIQEWDFADSGGICGFEA